MAINTLAIVNSADICAALATTWCPILPRLKRQNLSTFLSTSLSISLETSQNYEMTVTLH